MKFDTVLTVAESKRLIAKGVAALPCVKKALKNGLAVIATGTTNAYVVEEITGKSIKKPSYRSGIVTPPGRDKPDALKRELLPDVVLRKGKQDKSLDRLSVIDQLQPGDVYIKGANALHYPSRTAGILIGHPTGGTIGAAWGTIVSRKVILVVPVGLEKLVPEGIEDLNLLASDPDYKGPGMFAVTGEIVTEIEALKELTGARAHLLAAGGVAGAEGSVRLLVDGSKKEIEAARAAIDSVRGEPPYV
jgi:hypothetical protein